MVPHGGGSRVVARPCGGSRAPLSSDDGLRVPSSFGNRSRAVAPSQLPNSGGGTFEDEIQLRTGAANLSDGGGATRGWARSAYPWIFFI